MKNSISELTKPLKASEIELRIGNGGISGKGFPLLAYKTAR